MGRDIPLEGAIEAFCLTIETKLNVFHSVVGKGTNSLLAGDFIEELVRGFVCDWIYPCLLFRGTFWPFDVNPGFPEPSAPQIDGIVFDPRQGPPIIMEGDFVVAHPEFCPGVIEIKKSESNLTSLEQRLEGIHVQYYKRHNMVRQGKSSVMGIVIHDKNPEGHSKPEWLKNESECAGPIFILFTEVDLGSRYEPYKPAVESMIRTIFRKGWAFDPRLPQVQRDFGMMMLSLRNQM